MGDDAPQKPDVAGAELSQEHAHEVLTPLTVIRGHIQLARRYLSRQDGPRIDRALASLDIADAHVANAASVVHRRAKARHPDDEATR